MKVTIPHYCIVILALASTFPASEVSAVTVGNLICIAQDARSKPVAVSNATGEGAIITWQDERNGNSDIYAQRLCGCDSLDWDSAGVAICTAIDTQQHPAIISDSSEGAIIVWEDRRAGHYQLYVQKVNAWGVIQWAVNGVALNSSALDQRNPAIVSDSAGGAIITWEEKQSTGYSDIYVQRISGNGIAMWGASGVSVCTKPDDQLVPQIICNQKGGAIITWQDNRFGDCDIYAQRIDSLGIVRWRSNGVVICSAASGQLRPRIIGDRTSGALIVWHDFRSTTDYNIFAQRITAAGTTVWPTDGLVMNNNQSGDQINPVIAPDGSGGAIIAWEDTRAGDSDIYGQRVNPDGTVQWASTGISLCSAAGNQFDPQIVGIYSGGATIAWVDHRAVSTSIFMQRVTATGLRKSDTNGTIVYAGDSNQINPVIISDGNDGSIVAWQDFRNKDSDIYTRILSRDAVGIDQGAVSPRPTRSNAAPIRLSQNGILFYTVKSTGNVTLELMSLSGRKIAVLVNTFQNPGSYSVAISDNRLHRPVSDGVYLCRLTTDKGEIVSRISIMR